MSAFDELYIDSEQDADLSTVGGRIEWARRRQGMTQEGLSAAMPAGRRKSRASIALYESGKAVALEVIRDLAEVLHETPSFLAFGQRSDGDFPPPLGERVPLNPLDRDPSDVEYAFFPLPLLNQLDAGKKDLALVCLDTEAPLFGLRPGDYLLIDRASSVHPDGKQYVVRTSSGTAIARAEPNFTAKAASYMKLTSGTGASYDVETSSLNVLGRLIASVQRHI